MNDVRSQDIKNHLSLLQIPKNDSHKGQNGKLLLIGGSSLFHAASKWSLDTASKFVDMVFYSSTRENNELVKQAKSQFWNGIVIPRSELEPYIQEADCIVIGPGMERSEYQGLEDISNSLSDEEWETDTDSLSDEEWETDTEKIANFLLNKYPDKKWVIDAGALQMVDLDLLNQNCIILPHSGELVRVLEKISSKDEAEKTVAELEQHIAENEKSVSEFIQTNEQLQLLLQKGVTVLFKGQTDCVMRKDELPILVEGGSAGMTKGGTGDVLAGLVGALYCLNSSKTSAVVGSYVNKKAGEYLEDQVGPFFNASDLVEVVPQVFWEAITTLR